MDILLQELNNYLKAVYPSDIPPTQRQELTQAWFAAGLVIFKHLSQPRKTENELVAIAESMQRECDDYARANIDFLFSGGTTRRN